MVTDSQSVIRALQKGPLAQTSDTEDRIWVLLIRLANLGVEVLFQFVYAHCGITLNEMADAAAKEAVVGGLDTTTAWLTDLSRRVKARIRLERKAAMDLSVHREHLLGTTAQKVSSTLPRSTAVRFARLRTGESLELGIFRRRMKLDPSMACRWCCPEAHHDPASPPEPTPSTTLKVVSTARQVCPECGTSAADVGKLRAHYVKYHGPDSDHPAVLPALFVARHRAVPASRPKKNPPAAPVPPTFPRVISTAPQVCPACAETYTNAEHLRIHWGSQHRHLPLPPEYEPGAQFLFRAWDGYMKRMGKTDVTQAIADNASPAPKAPGPAPKKAPAPKASPATKSAVPAPQAPKASPAPKAPAPAPVPLPPCPHPGCKHPVFSLHATKRHIVQCPQRTTPPLIPVIPSHLQSGVHGPDETLSHLVGHCPAKGIVLLRAAMPGITTNLGSLKMSLEMNDNELLLFLDAAMLLLPASAPLPPVAVPAGPTPALSISPGSSPTVSIRVLPTKAAAATNTHGRESVESGT